MNAPLVLSVIALVITMMICMPFAFLWAITALFGIPLAWTFTNWLAAFILIALFGPTTVAARKH